MRQIYDLPADIGFGTAEDTSDDYETEDDTEDLDEQYSPGVVEEFSGNDDKEPDNDNDDSPSESDDESET